MSVRVWVTVGAAVSTVVIATSLIVVGKLFYDLNDLYYESLANDAWDEIMNVHAMGRAAQLEGYSPKRVSIFEEVMHKSKRSARRHTASCGQWPLSKLSAIELIVKNKQIRTIQRE
uniref:Col_cuticle_N domain-containing protein n=1 Tax=Ascaris lumbricoides TaxID=6252 RepID=A0A0M3HLL0_ASCLU